MAGKLIDSADEATLTHVARKLSLCADAPPSLLKRIRARGGEPEREILRVDPQIEWRDLRHVAASGPCDLACAVAARADLDREVARLLSARPEREIARALAANPLAPLTAESLRALAPRGRDDSALARALLDRCPPTLDFLPLYLAADPRERAKLIALALEASIAPGVRPATGDVLDDETAARIEAAALQQKRAAFALLLADRLQCDSLRARRIVEDERGDALALAFVAIGLPQAVAARIFLIAFPRIALSPELFERADGAVPVGSSPRRLADRRGDHRRRPPRSCEFCARRAEKPRRGGGSASKPAVAAPARLRRTARTTAPPDGQTQTVRSQITSSVTLPRRSSTSTIHRSGSKPVSFASFASTCAPSIHSSRWARANSRATSSRASLCGAGANKAAVPSSRSILTKMAPASGDPRRRRNTGTFSELHRRRKAATQISLRKRIRAS